MFRALQMTALAAIAMALAGATGLSGPRPVPAQAGPSDRALVFIVHKSNPLDNMSLQGVRKIFLGERSKWPDGQKVVLVMQEQGKEERIALLRLVYRVSESDYNRNILQSIFRGSVQTGPRLLSSAAGVVKFVSFVPAAIGYVFSGEEDDSVKVIKIDGLGPYDADYKLKLKAP